MGTVSEMRFRVDQAQRLLRSGIAQVERVEHGDHDAEQAHGDADARDGQDRPAAVAPAVLQDQGKIAHHTSLRITGCTSSENWGV